MNSLIVAAVKETAPGERRVAVVPEAVGRLTAAGFAVQVETDAGAAAWFPDEMYAEAGATVVTRDELYEQADIVVTVGKPSAATVARLRSGQVLVGLLSPLTDPELARDLADKGVTAVSLDGLPRTLSAAQSMDVLSSQANVTGYKAVLVAANTYGRYFPLLMTAAGTAKPAQVLILGAGVAGLQAIASAKSTAKQTYSKKQGLLAATAAAALQDGAAPAPVATAAPTSPAPANAGRACIDGLDASADTRRASQSAASVRLLTPLFCATVSVKVIVSPASPVVGAALFETVSAGSTMLTPAAAAVSVPLDSDSTAEFFLPVVARVMPVMPAFDMM